MDDNNVTDDNNDTNDNNVHNVRVEALRSHSLISLTLPFSPEGTGCHVSYVVFL